MWLNMRPYTTQLYSRTAVPYVIGISDQKNLVDQKRKTILVHPGKETMIKIIPRIVETTSDFDTLKMNQRNCKLSYETDGLEYLTHYSRVGCEMECAMRKAMSICKCIPWHYPNNFKMYPICEMFAGYCFDRVMSGDTNYWNCKQQCRKDCHETKYIVIEDVLPINHKKICLEGSSMDKQIKHNFQQYFAFHNYKTLVQGEVIPDLAKSYTNGSLCEDYVKSYLGFVNVYGPTSHVILTKRDKAFFFYDQLGTVGGTFGLFIGMSLLSFVEIAMLLVSIGYQIWQIYMNPTRFEEHGDLSVDIFNVGKSKDDARIKKMQGAIHVSVSHMTAFSS